jgi:hypothetical protein
MDVKTQSDEKLGRPELDVIYRLTDWRPSAKGRVLLRRIGSSHAYHMGAGFRDSAHS